MKNDERKFKYFRQGDLVLVKTDKGWEPGKVNRIRREGLGVEYMKVSMDNATVITVTDQLKVKHQDISPDDIYYNERHFKLLGGIAAIVAALLFALLILTTRKHRISRCAIPPMGCASWS